MLRTLSLLALLLSPAAPALATPAGYTLPSVKFAAVLLPAETARAEGEAAPAPAPQAPAVDPADLENLIKAIGGMKGLGALGIALLLVQLLMLAFKYLFKPTGGWQLAAVYGLSVIFGVLTVKATGADWGVALTNANVLAAVQVFLNQVLKKSVA